MARRATLAATAAVAAIALAASSAPLAQNGPVLAAMTDELARSMKMLRLNDQPAPYYIEYEVEDWASTRVTARLGALVEDLNGRGRTLVRYSGTEMLARVMLEGEDGKQIDAMAREIAEEIRAEVGVGK